MKTNKNVSERVYHILGFEHNVKVDFKMTVAELMSNGADDSELLYTLQEGEVDKILDLKIGDNLLTKSTRDSNDNNDIIIKRIK